MPSVIKLSSKLLSSPLTVENNSKLNFEKVLDGKNLELNNKKSNDFQSIKGTNVRKLLLSILLISSFNNTR